MTRRMWSALVAVNMGAASFPIFDKLAWLMRGYQAAGAEMFLPFFVAAVSYLCLDLIVGRAETEERIRCRRCRNRRNHK